MYIFIKKNILPLISGLPRKKIEINEKTNRTKSKTAMKWKTMTNAPKEENKDENLLIMSNVAVFRQDCSRINSRFLKVSLNITVL